jgi:hypothetical protein
VNDNDANILKRCLGKYRKVRITRSTPDEGFTHGYVLGLSDSLALLFSFHDFFPEACHVIRLRDIEGVQSGENERFWDRLLAAEGLLDAVGISALPPLDDMETLLKHLRDTNSSAIVEAENGVESDNGDEEESVYLIGRVVRVEDGTCWIHEFDALGQWEAEPYSIDVEYITQIQLEAPYMAVFLRNMPPFPGDLSDTPD